MNESDDRGLDAKQYLEKMMQRNDPNDIIKILQAAVSPVPVSEK
ncbi:hypothetical protein [uncultured Muriicola sp.]|nr:hypothetical protein [uncultured Muriicola sp.]